MQLIKGLRRPPITSTVRAASLVSFLWPSAELDCFIATGYWNWVRTVFRLTDDEILATYGIDVLTYLQFMRFWFDSPSTGLHNITHHFIIYSIILFSLISMFGMLLLLPVNMSGNLGLGLNATYLGNLDSGDFRHWFHFISCYVITGMHFSSCQIFKPSLIVSLLTNTAAVIFFTYRAFQEYIRRMHEYRSLALPNNYSAIVKGIPEDHRTSEKLLEQFDKFYPGQVCRPSLWIPQWVISNLTHVYCLGCECTFNT